MYITSHNTGREYALIICFLIKSCGSLNLIWLFNCLPFHVSISISLSNSLAEP